MARLKTRTLRYELLAVVEKVYEAVRALLGELLFGDSQ